MWESYCASCFCDTTHVCRSLVSIRITAAHALGSRATVDHGWGGVRSGAGCKVNKPHEYNEPLALLILNRKPGLYAPDSTIYKELNLENVTVSSVLATF